MSDELVIYLLVREDIKMSKGKTAVQCCHAVEDLIIRCPKQLLQQYKRSNHAKICLKIHDLEEMQDLMHECSKAGYQYYQVVDAGLTELKPDTPTVLGIGPVNKIKINPIVNKLKLL
jgi:PTH2 family peptidyl-tRNA hydrolase